MSATREHYVTTSDGVMISGTVYGRGPTLVFLQGIVGDCDLDWADVATHLASDFTCHLPSMRGRGRSEDHADLSLARLIDDVVAYLDSLGEPVGLTGWSGGGAWALAAAARCDLVRAVAPFEPTVLGVMNEQEQKLAADAVAGTAQLAEAGDLTGAMRAFAHWPFTDREIAGAEGYFHRASRYAPHLVRTLQQVMGSHDITADPAVLEQIRAPVRVLVGAETKRLFKASANYVLERVPQAHLREIPEAAHGGPLTHPRPLATAYAELFSSVLVTA